MKKISILFSLSMFFHPIISLAQTVGVSATLSPYSIKFSEEFKIPSEIYLFGVYENGKDNKVAVWHSPQKTDFTFVSFGDGMLVNKINQVSTEDIIGKGYSRISTLNLKNGTWVFFKGVSKKKQEQNVMALKYSLKDLDFEKQPVTAIDKLGMKDDCYNLFSSPDSTKLLLINYPKQANSKDPQKTIQLHVLNSDFTKNWSGEFKIPAFHRNPYEAWDRVSYLLSNDGKIFLFHKYFYEEKKIYKDGKPNFYYQVYIFEKNKKEPMVHTIEIDNFYCDPYGSPLMISRNDNSVDIIFLCNKESTYEVIGDGYVGRGTQGICIVRLNQGKGMTYKLKDYYYDFPLDVINQYTDEKNKKSIVEKLVLNSALNLNDGSLKIACEYDSRSDNRHPYIDGHLGSIFVLSFNSKNQFEWMKQIPRRHYNSSGDYSILVKNNILHIIYDDLKSNINLKPSQVPSKYTDRNNDGCIIGTAITSAGEISSYEFGKISKFPCYVLLSADHGRQPTFLLNDIEKINLGKKSIKRAYLISVQ